MVLLLSACSRRSEVVVSEGTVLTDAWLRISPKSRVATAAPVSGLFIVLPESSAMRWTDKELLDSNGERVAVEGYLETNNGTQMPLTWEPMTLNRTLMLEMTNPALEWTKNSMRIKSILLRSSVPVKTKKIIWVSDDPSNHKDGLVVPTDW